MHLDIPVHTEISTYNVTLLSGRHMHIYYTRFPALYNPPISIKYFIWPKYKTKREQPLYYLYNIYNKENMRTGTFGIPSDPGENHVYNTVTIL